MSGRYSYGIGTPPTLRRSASPHEVLRPCGDPAAAYASMPASSSLSSSGFPPPKSPTEFLRGRWRQRKRGAVGRLAPVNATRNVGRYLYPQNPYVLLLSEGMVRIDHQPKADLKSHPLKRQKNAPPCRCAANKTPSYATRWVASRAFTLPSSILRMGGLQSGQTEIRLPKEKCWIISYGADAHSRVLPAVIQFISLWQCGRDYSSSSSSRNSYSSLSLSRKISATRSSSSSSRMASR